MKEKTATIKDHRPHTARIYFIGAGASKADGFPLTAELKYGIAAAIVEDPERFKPLAEHLQYLYGVSDDLVRIAADTWSKVKERIDNPQPDPETTVLPNVTDLLSILDWMIRDQSSFGPGLSVRDNSGLSLGVELVHVRDLVVQALCLSMGQYARLDSASTTRAFLALVRPQDALITTNWDLLLDAARDARFGTGAEDYGTTGNVVVTHGKAPTPDGRPILLKLHGSLSWLYCQRCQRLVVDPWSHIAGDRTASATCECKCRFSELIVTPSFVREYRNVHLLNIWREAVLRLATTAEWVFIGYSLPPDDVGIRALLLKARRMRQDLDHPVPQVTVVTGPCGANDVLSRYRVIAPGAIHYDGGFDEYVRSQT